MSEPADDLELRCERHLWGILRRRREDRWLEIKCRYCARAKKARAVFHYFDRDTGELVDTVVVEEIGERTNEQMGKRG
jgi:hypothetical protein